MNTPEVLELGMRHHRAGRLGEARATYLQILAVQPNDPKALYLLGTVAFQENQYAAAAELLKKSLAISPQNAEGWFNFGLALQAQGSTDESIAAYRHAIDLIPNWPDPCNNLGTALQGQGKIDEAIRCFCRAVELKPDRADFHYNLGNAWIAKGNPKQAIEAYQCAVALRPEFAEAHNNLGHALCAVNRLEESVAFFRRAVSLRPQYAEAHNNLGEALRRLRRFDESIAVFQQALVILPDYPDALVNLALTLREKSRWDDAIRSCQHALSLRPDDGAAYDALGSIHYSRGAMEEAASAYRKLVALRPNDAEAHLKYATTLLLLGQWEAGWAEFEWRLGTQGMESNRGSSSNQWDGSDPAGMRILVHPDNSNCGYGDCLQMIRFIPLLRQRGATVLVECKPGLVSLFESVPGIDQLIPEGQPLPAWDRHVPMLSLPGACRINPLSLPNSGPYLSVPPDQLTRWAGKIPRDERMNIGLVWAGRPRFIEEEVRTSSLAIFAPLSQVPKARFFSLQLGPESSQPPPKGVELVDLTSGIHDFSDTAALIQHLDLVITVDTAVAHLAGALGKPVWVLLPFVPGWFWMLSRPDSPWYPTMRLFRQPKRDDWETPLAAVVEALLRKATC